MNNLQKAHDDWVNSGIGDQPEAYALSEALANHSAPFDPDKHLPALGWEWKEPDNAENYWGLKQWSIIPDSVEPRSIFVISAFHSLLYVGRIETLGDFETLTRLLGIERTSDA